MMCIILYFFLCLGANLPDSNIFNNRTDAEKEALSLNENLDNSYIQIDCEKKKMLHSEIKDDIINRLEQEVIPGKAYNDFVSSLEPIIKPTWVNELKESRLSYVIEDMPNRKEYNECLNIACILSKNQLNNFDNFPITLTIISKTDKLFSPDDCFILGNMLYKDTSLIKFSLVVKITLKTNSRKNSFFLNLLNKNLEELLRNFIISDDFYLCDDNQFYKLIVYYKNCELCEIIQESYHSKRLKTQNEEISPVFNLLAIFPNTVLETGIDRLLTCLRKNINRAFSNFDSVTYFIVASRSLDSLLTSENIFLRKFVDRNYVQVELQCPSINGPIITEYIKPNISWNIHQYESNTNDIKLNKYGYQGRWWRPAGINVKRSSNILNQYCSFKFYNTAGNWSSFYRNEFRIHIDQKGANIEENYEYDFSLNIIGENEDPKRVQKYITLQIFTEKNEGIVQQTSKPKDQKLYKDILPKDSIESEFMLSWIFDETEDKLSCENTLTNIIEYKKALISIKNMKLLLAFYAVNVLSEKPFILDKFFTHEINFLTDQTSFFIPNINLENMTISETILFVFKKLNINHSEFLYLTYIYDLNENSCKNGDEKNREFFKKEIPAIEDHSFFKEEIYKYENIKKLPDDSKNIVLENNKGLFLISKISGVNTCYITLRCVKGFTIELDDSEGLFLNNIKKQLNKCIEKIEFYRYFHHYPQAYEIYGDLKNKFWDAVLSLKDFLADFTDLPEPHIVDSWIISRLNTIDSYKIVEKYDKKASENALKTLAQSSARVFFNNNDFKEELEIYKIQMCKIISNAYNKIFSKKSEYNGLFYGYFFRTSEIDYANDSINLKKSFYA